MDHVPRRLGGVLHLEGPGLSPDDAPVPRLAARLAVEVGVASEESSSLSCTDPGGARPAQDQLEAGGEGREEILLPPDPLVAVLVLVLSQWNTRLHLQLTS